MPKNRLQCEYIYSLYQRDTSVAPIKDNVKEKGKQIKVNKNPQTLRDASNLGAYYTDNTPTKTFKLLPAKGVARQGETSYQFDPSRYKQKKGTYIEKNKYAIDTKGEREGITVKGLKARQQNSALNKILGKSNSKSKKAFTF